LDISTDRVVDFGFLKDECFLFQALSYIGKKYFGTHPETIKTKQQKL
jgi:hypothetical protein